MAAEDLSFQIVINTMCFHCGISAILAPTYLFTEVWIYLTVPDCLQAASKIGAFLALFWPGLCRTDLLCFAYSVYHTRLQMLPSYCSVLLVLGFSDTLVIFVHNNNDFHIFVIPVHWLS